MSAVRWVLPIGATAFVVLACAASVVPRFAPCAANDTCPYATVCEDVAAPSAVASFGSMCTWSCTTDDIDPNPCPNDVNGTRGVCAGTVGDVPVGQTDYGMCFQSCTTNDDCTSGTTCVGATIYGTTSQARVCAAVPTDELASTSWQSSTITASAASNGVQSSTYTMTFGAQTSFALGMSVGAFTATLVQVHDDVAYHALAGCTETTTYSGGVWADRPPSSTQPGNLEITGASSSTTRTGCRQADLNGTNVPGEYFITQGIAGYYLSADGSTLNMGGGYGSLPYGDSVEWTFTRQ